MKEQIKTLLTELREIHLKEFDVTAKIRAANKDFVLANRTINIRQKVNVIDAHDESILGVGIVLGVKNYLSTDPLSISNYIEKEETYIRDLTQITYEIYAVKKDGTPSKQHFFEHPHYIPAEKGRHVDYYIKPI